MLVLTGKDGMVFRVGDNIAIKVMKTEKGRVSLAFDAPKDIAIVRSDAKVTERKEVTNAD